jgi:hypothetical protein
MTSSVLKRLPSAVPLVLLAGVLHVPAAAANGPCGQDSSNASACAFNSPGTVFGSLTIAYEHDYYRFYAKKGTRLAVNLTDMEPATCEVSYGHCGVIEAGLQSSDGVEIDHSGFTEPVNGIPTTTALTHTLGSAGTYYVTVYGFLGIEGAGKPAPDPYSLSISASPAVYWPKSPRTSGADRHGRMHGRHSRP